MMYPFAAGDLRDASVCLFNYMDGLTSQDIPWDDLRYLFGEIIYGGHIVDDFDRRLCMTYLDFYMRDGLLEERYELFPYTQDDRAFSFTTINAAATHENFTKHIDEEFKTETPLAFGLNPNAEIGFRTTMSSSMFDALLSLQKSGGSEGAGDSSMSPEHVAETTLLEILDRIADRSFDIEMLDDALDESARGPFQNVFLQECKTVNMLLDDLTTSLTELNMGFAGEVTFTSAMEDLVQALYLERIPELWSKSWPSMRGLGPWLTDLLMRIDQLKQWTEAPLDVPAVTWLPGLAYPKSFLTAIKQVAAGNENLELDKLAIQTEVTKRHADEVENAAGIGAHIHGLYIDGARWDISGSIVEKSRPKEMYFLMPVITARAVLATKIDKSTSYMCPTYATAQRGPTYVFTAQLKTKSSPARWILAGVALLMDNVGL